MFTRLMAVYRNHTSSKNRVTFDDLVLLVIVLLFLLNGFLFFRVVTTQEGRALEADHIRKIRRTLPNVWGKCSEGYELSTLKEHGLVTQSSSQEVITLLSNVAFRLLKGRSVHKCVPCKPGFSKDKNTKSCTPCYPGYYQAGYGSGTCLRCPPGSYQPHTGSPSCLACPAGYYQPESGGVACLKCPEQTYQPLNGSSECIPCTDQDHTYSCDEIEELGGAGRDCSLSCLADRCKSEPDEEENLLPQQEEQELPDEDGGFFSGFLPNFDTLTELLDSNGEEEEKEEKEEIKEEKDEIKSLDLTEETQAQSEQASEFADDEEQEELVIETKEEDQVEETEDLEVEALVPEPDLEAQVQLSGEETEDNVIDTSEIDVQPETELDSDQIGENAVTDQEIEEVQYGEMSEDESDDNVVSVQSEQDIKVVDDVVEENVGLIEKSSQESGNVPDEVEQLDHPVKTDEKLQLMIQDPLKEDTADIISDNAAVKDQSSQDASFQQPPLPTRSSDHPVLQNIAKNINESNKKSKQSSPPADLVESEDEVASLPGDDTTSIAENVEQIEEQEVISSGDSDVITAEEAEIIYEESFEADDLESRENVEEVVDSQLFEDEILASDDEEHDSLSELKENSLKDEKVVEGDVDNVEGGDVVADYKEDPEVSSQDEVQNLPESSEDSSDQTLDGSPEILENEYSTVEQFSNEEPRIIKTAEEVSNTAASSKGCDLVAAIREWVTEGKTVQLRRLEELLVSQFAAIRHHGHRVLGSDLHMMVIPIALSIVLGYICLLGSALHMLLVTEGNFLMMFCLLTEMVFLASFTLLEDTMSGDHIIAAVLLVLFLGLFSTSLRTMDQLSKAKPKLKFLTKLALMMLMTTLSVIVPLLTIDCDLMTSEEKYFPLKDEDLLQLLCITRILSIPSVLIRIDCEIARSPSRSAQGVHLVELLLESTKFVLAICTLFSDNLLHLIILCSVMVAIQSLQQLLWEILLGKHHMITSENHVTGDHVTGELKKEEVQEFTQVRKLVQSSSSLVTGMLVREKETDKEEEEHTPSHLQQILTEGIEVDKSELSFERGRLSTNRDVVVYINKEVVEEMVSFNSANECKLYLAQMTGSCESLESVLQQVRRDSKNTNSDSSNEDYIMIPKIVVESGDSQKLQDCLCVDSERSTDRRRCRSAESGHSRNSSDPTRTEEPLYNLLDEELVEEEDRRCHSSLSSFGSGSCLTCRKTKL